ncbi:MAG: hypothetical protein IPP27_08490 [Bacteroidetes bacterium]|nr:hypothetical protein [Bacteroidota bacterium]
MNLGNWGGKGDIRWVFGSPNGSADRYRYLEKRLKVKGQRSLVYDTD